MIHVITQSVSATVQVLTTDEDIKMKAVELAIDYLNDIDDEKGGKIWKRFNG